MQHISKDLSVGVLGILVGCSLFGFIQWIFKNKKERIQYKQDKSLPFNFTSNVRDGFSGAIGDSPLIYLRSLSEETGCHIFVSYIFTINESIWIFIIT